MLIFTHPTLPDTVTCHLTEHQFFGLPDQKGKCQVSHLLNHLLLHPAQVLIISHHLVDMAKLMAGLEKLFYHQIRPALIITCQDKHLAYQAYQLGIDGYLLEPIDPLQLAKILDRLQISTLAQSPRTPTDNKERLAIRTSKGLSLLSLDQVFYIQAEHKYLRLHYHKGQELIDGSLKKLAEAHPNLIRIHRKTLVNPQYITDLSYEQDQCQLVMQDGSRLDVSRRSLAKLRQYFRHLS